MSKISVKEKTVSVDLQGISFFDGTYFISYIPALNISSHSLDRNKSRKEVENGIDLFFKYWINSGKLHNKLIQLGWHIAQEQKGGTIIGIPTPSKNMNVEIPLDVLL